MDHFEFISFLLEAPDFEERRWGKTVLEGQKFDFGPGGDEMPKLADPEKVLSYFEYCPRAFNLPFPNCLFYTTDSIFLHTQKSAEADVIETRLCTYNENDDYFYYSPVVGFIDFQSRQFRGEPFLDTGKMEKTKELETLTLHYCLLASFLAILNSRNVQPVDNLPSRKKHVAAGRTIDNRLFIYKTLHVKPQFMNGRNAAGSSRILSGKKSWARVHLERGHLRKVPPGKIVWIQPVVAQSPGRRADQKDLSY